MRHFDETLTSFVLGAFRKPTAMTLAVRELDEAKREQLKLLANKEYYTHMVDCNAARIKRLAAYLAKEERNDG
jgi:UDP-3-O-[3-hydroxymyristoyl] glucosamine N-acyltransferase